MKAIPTEYKNVKFKSLLEARYARALDDLNIAWLYEVNGYDINGIWYVPDFWLPEIKTFLEVKGPGIPGAEKAKALDKELTHGVADPEYLVVIGNESGDLRTPYDQDEVHIVNCLDCEKNWLMAFCGYYGCRNCGAYDGDIFLGETLYQMPLSQF